MSAPVKGKRRKPKQRMRVHDAMDLVDDDMPDGAYGHWLVRFPAANTENSPRNFQTK